MVAVQLSKVIVVTINVIFLIFGIAALAVGIVFKVAWSDVRDAFNFKDQDAVDLQAAGDILGYAAIVLGCFIIVVSLLGCIGACCQLKLLLGLYAIIVLLLIIAEVVLVALIATHANQTKDIVGKAMNKTLSTNYYENSTDSMSRSYSALFNTLECCGVTTYNETFPYDEQAQKNLGFYADPLRRAAGIKGERIPITCCRSFNYKNSLTKEVFTSQQECLQTPTSKNAYTEGCLDTTINKITDNKAVVIGVGVAILVLEIVMVIVAFFLCCRSSDD